MIVSGEIKSNLGTLNYRLWWNWDGDENLKQEEFAEVELYFGNKDSAVYLYEDENQEWQYLDEIFNEKSSTPDFNSITAAAIFKAWNNYTKANPDKLKQIKQNRLMVLGKQVEEIQAKIQKLESVLG